MTVTRLGFAYNPTSEDALELRERAAGWCRMHGVEQWAAPAGETADSSTSCAGPTPSSCSAATARSCAPRGRSPRSTSRSSASTWARSASCPRPRRTSSRRCSSSSRRARSRSASGWRSTGQILQAGRDAADGTFTALNDIVVARGSLARVVRLDVTSTSRTWRRSSPTGSSSRAPPARPATRSRAGGPILDPHSRNLVVTPIAGYLSAIRSIVVGAAPGRPGPGRSTRTRRSSRSTAARTAGRGRRRGRGPRAGAADPVHRARRRAAVLGPAADEGRAAAVVTDDGVRPGRLLELAVTDLALIDRLRLALAARAQRAHRRDRRGQVPAHRRAGARARARAPTRRSSATGADERAGGGAVRPRARSR